MASISTATGRSPKPLAMLIVGALALGMRRQSAPRRRPQLTADMPTSL